MLGTVHLTKLFTFSFTPPPIPPGGDALELATIAPKTIRRV